MALQRGLQLPLAVFTEGNLTEGAEVLEAEKPPLRRLACWGIHDSLLFVYTENGLNSVARFTLHKLNP